MTECLLNKKLVLIILSTLELCLSENGAKLKKKTRGNSDCNIFLSKSLTYEFLILQWKHNVWTFYFSSKIKLLIILKYIFWPFCIEGQHKSNKLELCRGNSVAVCKILRRRWQNIFVKNDRSVNVLWIAYKKNEIK